VFLNRVPDYMEALRNETADVLVAAVTPDQQAIGRIQAEQLGRLGPGDRLVLLVTGTASNESAIARRKGFADALPFGTDLHVLEGDWSEPSGHQALADFFRLGTQRGKRLAAVACQNDAMALGVRRGLADRAAEVGDRELARLPVLGCDGLPNEGQRMVADGTLAGTVIMPPTSGRALDLLAAYWESGARADVVRLEPDSHPPLSQIQSA
jgi:ABC-type sugar transport system substrate-binding protein